MKYVMLYEQSLNFRVLISEVSDWFQVLHSIMEKAGIANYQELGLKDISIDNKEALKKLFVSSREEATAILKTEYDKSKSIFGNEKIILGESILVNLQNDVDSRLSFVDDLCNVFQASIESNSTVHLFERSFLSAFEKRILLVVKSTSGLTLKQLAECLNQQGEVIDDHSNPIKKTIDDLTGKNYISLDGSVMLPTLKLQVTYI
jgi:hypothetical protein